MDFLGTFNLGDLMAAVTQGVQTTGTPIYSLIQFLGVPIAITIMFFVITFLYRGIKGPVDRIAAQNHKLEDALEADFYDELAARKRRRRRKK